MPETILPGVTIEVRAEGLIVPLGITVGNLGVVGTASKGPISTPVILGSFAEARAAFGDYDPWNQGAAELTLVRALELAFDHGATTAIAVRVADTTSASKAAKAQLTLKSASGDCVDLAAKSEGTWGNDIQVNVAVPADGNAFVEDETVTGGKLGHHPVVPSALNRIRVKPGGGGPEQSLQILYDPAAPTPGQVSVKSDGTLTFGTAPGGSDAVLASYMVDHSQAAKVTIRYQNTEETYLVVNGDDLIHDLTNSALVSGAAKANSKEIPLASAGGSFSRLAGGANGAGGAKYKEDGLDKLLDQEAHIIVAAGKDDLAAGSDLANHCQVASSDTLKRDRIAIVGSGDLSKVAGHNLNSDRVVFVAPGITVSDNAAVPPVDVTLPGSYAAAAVAGLLASQEPHISLTNKVLSVDGLEKIYTLPELRQLVQARVLALEKREGFRIVKGITTSTDTAFAQITTRRIVDYAKFGVRSAANPFIGKLNNERVRDALRSSINSVLSDMVHAEMLESYELSVSATRPQEIRGIVQVTMVLRPTFSIDFIQVTIFLE
ncbi:MAG TPA: phage tail sheath C-terminal domain-containing protein [Acidimicrobiales bacterium]|nr:phage tail sheath C-terminal domain-containing protein [Acidimicrobiales bacterium]